MPMRSGLTYRSTAFAVVLAASVCLAIANAFRALHAPFAVEIAEVVVFCLLIELAFKSVITPNSLDLRRDRKRILPLFGLVGLCAIAVFFVFAFLATKRAVVHVFFPVLFPCLIMVLGERLVTARGLKIVQTLIGATTRVLIVLCVSLVFLAANLGLSALLLRMGALTPGAFIAAIAALSCDLFLKFAPFALYAVTLRESFRFEGEQSHTTESG